MFGFLKKFRDQFLNEAGRGIGEVEAELQEPLYPVWHPYRACVDPEKLWRGARPKFVDLCDLAGGGFKTVVDLRAEAGEQASVDSENSGIENYVWIPVIDNTVPTCNQVDRFIWTVTQSKFQPVYVHCEAGIGRTGCFVAAYRVKVQGWTAAAALEEARRYGLGLPCQVEWIQALGA